MAPTFYHYLPVPMDLKVQQDPERCRWWLPALVLALLAAVVALSAALGIFVHKAHSPACLEGLRAEQECHSATSVLQRQLSRAQEGMRQTETQAARCNHTVANLTALLEAAKAKDLQKQVEVKELQGEILQLNVKLQDSWAQVERLRKENSALRDQHSGAQAGAASSRGAAAPLLLGLGLAAALLGAPGGSCWQVHLAGTSGC
ncbi:bone marrow stromal antigen 2 [Lepus europaeus]|uniref:bone marrow stromal antigen 2 n=1 Tax=Lepus europaeus TaxID=9983 RepID=UPI002B47C67A|nr:bone marrow stromal antigen 2 [Lepus europaeus]